MINEQTYPIEARWVVKMTIGYGIGFLTFAVLLAMGIYDFRFILALIVLAWSFVFFVLLARPYFRYALEEKYLTVKQGVFRKQERHVPYGVIQHMVVSQDLLDRLFGLASLSIEDASQGGQNAQNQSSSKVFGLTVMRGRRQYWGGIGFTGNRISIPGLTMQNAEAMKAAVLKKMKDNPLEDTMSGL